MDNDFWLALAAAVANLLVIALRDQFKNVVKRLIARLLNGHSKELDDYLLQRYMNDQDLIRRLYEADLKDAHDEIEELKEQLHDATHGRYPPTE